MTKYHWDSELDSTGLLCPLPVLKIRKKLKEMQSSSNRLRRSTLVKDLFHLDYFPKREDDSKDIIIDKLLQINRKTWGLQKKTKAGEVDIESEQIEINNEFEKIRNISNI